MQQQFADQRHYKYGGIAMVTEQQTEQQPCVLKLVNVVPQERDELVKGFHFFLVCTLWLIKCAEEWPFPLRVTLLNIEQEQSAMNAGN